MDLLEFEKAAELLGISINTLRNRVKEFGLTLYTDARDKRKKLLLRTDIEILSTPQPIKTVIEAEQNTYQPDPLELAELVRRIEEANDEEAKGIIITHADIKKRVAQILAEATANRKATA